MTFRYHGNWCGPGWSDGRYVPSTKGFAPAVDEFDETCRQHDFSLAGGATDDDADDLFFQSNFGKGPKRSLAAVAVAVRNRLDHLTTPRTVTKPPKQNKRISQLSIMPNNTKQNKQPTKAPKKNTPTMRRNDSTRAAPVAIATKRTAAKPVIASIGDGVSIAHRSFLQPIDNNADFEVTGFACNPGLPGSFPWLSKIARRYEEYRFKKLRYEFRSVVASTTSGVIMMSFDYDAADQAPSTKAEQAQTVPNSETNVWMNNDLIVRPDSGWHFVRSGNLASNLDIKTYDMGNLWLSSAYGNNVIGGELYVEYVVELRRPTDGPEVSGRFSSDTGAFSAPVNSTNALIKGVAFPFARFDNLSFTVISSGDYLMVCEANGTGLTAAISLPTITSNTVGALATTLTTAVSATTTLRVVRLRVFTGDTIVFTNAGTGTTITNTRFYVAGGDYNSFA